MILPSYRNYNNVIHITTVLVLLTWSEDFTTAVPTNRRCPIGFKLAYTKDMAEILICYKLKGPETFADKFQECAGNLYTSKLHDSLNIIETSLVLWTDYKTLYPSGPFIDMSYTKSTGENLETVRSYKYDHTNSNDCLVKIPGRKLEVVKCNELYHRYCFVEPYLKHEDMNNYGCTDLDGFLRFSSPKATCLKFYEDPDHLGYETPWKDTKYACEPETSVLSKGWRYANYPFLKSEPMTTYPLSMKFNSDTNTLRFDTVNNKELIPSTEWNFKSPSTTSDVMNIYGAIRDGYWRLVNDDYSFNAIICERIIELKNINMNITVNSDNIIIMISNDTIDKNDFMCFTDSLNYFPTKVVDVISEHGNKIFIITPNDDGYYWCIITNTTDYYVSESNKALYIKNKESLTNTYAVKINFHSVTALAECQNQLEQYIFYRTEYIKENLNDLPDSVESKTELEKFKMSHSSLRFEKGSLVHKAKLKRTIGTDNVLLHIRLNPNVKLSKGSFQNITVMSIKPVYFCKDLDTVKTKFSLGSSMNSPGCRTYNCVGDFNEGVEWDVTLTSNCSVTPPTPLDTSAQAKEQLKEVIGELKTLVLNKTEKITVDDVDATFAQVNSLVDHEDVDVPGNLLNLLDKLGSRIDLDGSNSAVTVESNIALLVTDAKPESPVRGLRIAAAKDEQFTINSFEIISEFDDSHLAVENSDAVVYLPEYLATSSRRISFVVFRTDKAFQSRDEVYSVNSNIISINVENVTKFEPGQVIDIYLSPKNGNGEIDSNRRTCAYWQFLKDGTGYWSQDGCIFIKTNTTGGLDTCRCDHLTHFAEILIPLNNISKLDNFLLEIITITGCCLSIFGLCIIGMTAALFRSWRKEYSNKVWLQLCIAIFILVLCFLITIFARFDHSTIPCMIIGIALHYSVLVSFCWMLVASVFSYSRLVIVFSRDASHKLLRASIFSWGAPCVVVGIVLLADSRSYAGQFETKTPGGAFCYPSGLSLWLSVDAPIAAILLANWTLFSLIVSSVFCIKNKMPIKHNTQNEALKCAKVSCVLVFLFGLPWTFGLIPYSTIAAYLFTLTASYQGFVLFVFFILGNKKTRDLWIDKFNITTTKKTPATYSTYTNKSIEVGHKHKDLKGTPAIEANLFTPKSLMTPDNSVFC